MSFHFKHQLEEDNARLKKENEALRELVYISEPILDNLLYWETCPDFYKKIIENWLEKLKQIKEGK